MKMLKPKKFRLKKVGMPEVMPKYDGKHVPQSYTKK